MLTPSITNKNYKKNTTTASLATIESMPPPSANPSMLDKIQVIDSPEKEPRPVLPRIVGIKPGQSPKADFEKNLNKSELAEKLKLTKAVPLPENDIESDAQMIKNSVRTLIIEEVKYFFTVTHVL